MLRAVATACVLAAAPAVAGPLVWDRPAMLAALPLALAPLRLAHRRVLARPPILLPTAELLHGLRWHRRGRADRLLTAARMVLLAAVVCAFAGPTWRAGQAPTTRLPASATDASLRAPVVDEPAQNAPILIIGSRGSMTRPSVADLLAHALAAGQRWTVRRLDPQEVMAADLRQAGQVWFSDDLEAGANTRAALFAAVRQGGSLAWVAHNPRTTSAREAAIVRPHAAADTVLVATAQRDLREGLPAVSPLAPTGSALSSRLAAAMAQAIVLPRWHTRAGADATVHLELVDGQPVVAESRWGRGRILVIALDLSWRPDDVPAADLPRRGVFAWFVQELADHLAVAPRLDADDGPVAPAREAVAAPRPLHGALLLAAAFAWCVERLLSMADGAARPER